jgi:bacterial/archaeal transporter family protein
LNRPVFASSKNRDGSATRRLRHRPIQTAPPKPASGLKTAIFIVVAVLTNSFGNLLLSLGMSRMPDFYRVPFLHYLFLLVANPFVIPGVVVSLIYALVQLSLFSWADLSYVVPLIASSYIVTTILSRFILHEQVVLARWLGVVLISLGVALIAKTPPHTVGEPDEVG